MTTSDEQDVQYFVMKGRRWRKTDPQIPSSLKAQLTKELMSARRAVKAALASNDVDQLKQARARVHDAKVALGERGPKWWEPYDDSGLDQRLLASTRAMLRHRGEGKTVCPSEIARIVGGIAWRERMPRSVEIAWQLEKDGWLQVTQKGLAVSQPTRGPIRLRKTKRK